MNKNNITIQNSARHPDNKDEVIHRSTNSEYLITTEAALYLRKSISWLTRRPDIPYVRGAPNIYKKEDLDSWFERNKFTPEINW